METNSYSWMRRLITIQILKFPRKINVHNVNPVFFFFFKGCDSAEKGLVSMALQCGWVLCFGISHKLARKTLTGVADFPFRSFGWLSDSKLTHVVTGIFGCFRDVEWLDGHPYFLASPEGISEHGGFLEIKPERRGKENIWTGWSHVLL